MTQRRPDHPIDPIFHERWSPRAFDRSIMPAEDWATILEAARWAPSAFNAQPWRILYAMRDGPDWERFVSLLVPANQSWAINASVLAFFVSDTVTERKDGGTSPNHSHSFDTGSAWMSMALQASRMGYHAHGMSGVEFERAAVELKVPERYRIEAAAAFGRQGAREDLPEPHRSREVPSGRKRLDEFAFAGDFPS